MYFLKNILDPWGPMLFKCAWAWSNGVLAGAIAMFQNSMVFHSPKHMSILAVHIGPVRLIALFICSNLCV